MDAAKAIDANVPLTCNACNPIVTGSGTCSESSLTLQLRCDQPPSGGVLITLADQDGSGSANVPPDNFEGLMCGNNFLPAFAVACDTVYGVKDIETANATITCSNTTEACQ